MGHFFVDNNKETYVNDVLEILKLMN